MVEEMAVPVWMQIQLIGITIAIPIAIAWAKGKIGCLDKVNKRSFRQSKAHLNLAAKLDEMTKDLHKDSEPTFYNQMERDLKDENGNL
jgi:hypothetical protein